MCARTHDAETHSPNHVLEMTETHSANNVLEMTETHSADNVLEHCVIYSTTLISAETPW